MKGIGVGAKGCEERAEVRVSSPSSPRHLSVILHFTRREWAFWYAWLGVVGVGGVGVGFFPFFRRPSPVPDGLIRLQFRSTNSTPPYLSHLSH